MSNNILSLIPKPVLALGSIAIGVDLLLGNGNIIRGVANTQIGQKVILVAGLYVAYESGLISNLIKQSFLPSLRTQAESTKAPSTGDTKFAECFDNLPLECSGLNKFLELNECCTEHYHG